MWMPDGGSQCSKEAKAEAETGALLVDAACAAVTAPTSPPPAKVRPDPSANPEAFGRVVCLLFHAISYLRCVPICAELFRV
jgi:hypothetical protein